MKHLHLLKDEVAEDYIRRILTTERLSQLLGLDGADQEEIEKAATPSNVKKRLSAVFGVEMKAADLHVHSSYSHDILSTGDNDPLSLYERGRAIGLDYIVITDHAEKKPLKELIEAWQEIGRMLDGKEGFVRGQEFTLPLRYEGDRLKKRGSKVHTVHSNVYCLTQSDFETLFSLAEAGNLRRFIGYSRDRDLRFSGNHLLWVEMGEEEAGSRLIFRIAKKFPVTEWNMHQTEMQNLTALLLASRLRKGIYACTDAHIGDIGSAFTVAPGDTFKEFYDNIARGNAFLVPKNLTSEYLTKETIKFIDGMFDSRVRISHNAVVTETHALNRTIVYLTNYAKHLPFSGVAKYLAKKAVEDYGVSVKWRVRAYHGIGERMLRNMMHKDIFK